MSQNWRGSWLGEEIQELKTSLNKDLKVREKSFKKKEQLFENEIGHLLDDLYLMAD